MSDLSPNTKILVDVELIKKDIQSIITFCNKIEKSLDTMDAYNEKLMNDVNDRIDSEKEDTKKELNNIRDSIKQLESKLDLEKVTRGNDISKINDKGNNIKYALLGALLIILIMLGNKPLDIIAHFIK